MINFDQSTKFDEMILSNAFSPLPSFVGGLAMGVVVCCRYVLWGKVTGISGMAASALNLSNQGNVAFIVGLLGGGIAMQAIYPEGFESMSSIGFARAAIAGLLVGFGTQTANGCTTGHGICGLSRLSPRSLVATMTFMMFGCITAIAAKTASVTDSVSPPALGPWYQLSPPLPLLSASAIMGAFFMMMVASSANAESGFVFLAVEFCMGMCFAAGLTISGMVKPSKVASFLDPTGAWDPSLALVMAGALLLSAPTWAMVYARGPAMPAGEWNVFKSAVDWRLVAGAALFGVGWGTAGVCPGPALVALSGMELEAVSFAAAMAAGTLLHRLLFSTASPAAAAAAAAAKSK